MNKIKLEGWIKLHRKMVDWEWYDDANVVATFIHLLLDANWKDKKWHGKLIERGTFITSLSGLAKEIGISVQQLRTSLNKLESTNEITRSTSSIYTHISINNYTKYQQVTNEVTNEQQTSNKRATTTKEYKNIRNKEIYKEISSEKILEIAERYGVTEKSVKETYEDLILYCKSKGKTYKDYEAALMTWVRNNIKSGKTKIVPQTIKVEPISEFTDEQRQNNLKRLAEMRAKLPIILHQ